MKAAIGVQVSRVRERQVVELEEMRRAARVRVHVVRIESSGHIERLSALGGVHNNDVRKEIGAAHPILLPKARCSNALERIQA
jgi:hypothetical protein